MEWSALGGSGGERNGSGRTSRWVEPLPERVVSRTGSPRFEPLPEWSIHGPSCLTGRVTRFSNASMSIRASDEGHSELPVAENRYRCLAQLPHRGPRLLHPAA